MKKLILVLAAVAIGATVNAASFEWKVQSGYIWDGATSPAKVTSGTAYLLFAETLSQSSLVTAFAADSTSAKATVAANAVSSATIASTARIAATSFTSSVTTDQTAYFVIFNDDKMYVSITADAEYAAIGESAIAFGNVTTSSKKLSDASSGYSDAGWYSAAAIPEPTSGLLMLLGMAGLALKRKRA